MLGPKLRQHSRIEIVDITGLGADDDGDGFTLIERSLSEEQIGPPKGEHEDEN